MKDSKSTQETVKYSYEEYVRDPIACGYTLIEKDGEQFYSKTYKYDNCTVIVNRPVLTSEERKKREQQIMNGVANIYRDMYGRDPELANRLLACEEDEKILPSVNGEKY